MWITPERVFYAGLLGQPERHAKGGLAVYVAIEGPLRLRLDGGDWQSAEVAVVPPYVPAQVACEGRHVIVLVIEPESLVLESLPPLLRERGPVDSPAFAQRVRDVHARMVASNGCPPETVNTASAEFDLLFFGEALPARRIDARIAAALDRLREDLAEPVTAEACAAAAGWSVSRFLHRFKDEVGASFRVVRAWKRARGLLHHVRRDENLVHVALDIGYPDSTHFSHSIRQTYGLKPRDIFAGSRKLRIIDGL